MLKLCGKKEHLLLDVRCCSLLGEMNTFQSIVFLIAFVLFLLMMGKASVKRPMTYPAEETCATFFCVIIPLDAAADVLA